MQSWILRLQDTCPWSPSARLATGAALPRLGAAAQRVEALAQRYPVSRLSEVCGPIEMAESLYVLDLLDRFLSPPQTGRCLDIGSKYGAYMPGLWSWCHAWDAIERLAHARYWNLCTRRAYGEAYARALPGCQYIAGDVRNLHGPYTRILWILPFLFDSTAQAWGFPSNLLNPQQTLQHSLNLLEEGGEMLILNQGESEYQEQERLLGACMAPAEALGPVLSVLSPFKKPRYGWRIIKAPKVP